MIQNLKLTIAFISSVILWYAVYIVFTDYHINQCNMTYMFELPEYIKIKMKNSSFPQYNLYVYGEGSYAFSLSRGTFNGIPVLFLSGNKGSYKQVRSLASVAYRKSQNYRHNVKFDFFALDFNEDLGALDGACLDSQTTFTKEAVTEIMSLYKNRENAIVVIGHSMGGLVARSLLVEDSPYSIPLILTLAAPHTRPVAILDWQIEQFYDKLNRSWAEKSQDIFERTAFVTIGGGRNDPVVPTFLTTSSYADVDTTLLSVPSCWLTTDHLAMAWCKQLVLAIVRGLFDSVDAKQKIWFPKSTIVRNFKNRLIEDRSDSSGPTESALSTLLRKGRVSEVKSTHFSAEFTERNIKQAFAVPLIDESGDKIRHADVIVTGARTVAHLILCRSDSGNFGTNDTISIVANSGRQFRSIPGDSREANVDLRDAIQLYAASHLIIYVEFSAPAGIQLSVYTDDPDWWIFDVPAIFPPEEVVIDVAPKSLAVNLTVQGWTEIWQSFVLKFEPTSGCAENELRPVASIYHAEADRWSFALPNTKSPLSFSLELDSPLRSSEDATFVHFSKNLECDVRVRFYVNYAGMLRRLCLTHFCNIPSWMVSQTLLMLAHRYKSVEGAVSFTGAWFPPSPLFVLPFVKILSFALASGTWIETDLSYGARHRMTLNASLVVGYLACVPLTSAAHAVVRLLIAFGARFLSRPGPSAKEASSPGPLSLFVFGAVVAASLSLSAALALLLLFVLDLYRVTKLWRSARQAGPDAASETSVLLTLLIGFCAVLRLPSLVSWWNAVAYHPQADQDVGSVVTCVALVLGVSLVCLSPKFLVNRRHGKAVGYALHLVAILTILFGSVRIYVVSRAIAVSLLIVGTHQHVASPL